MIRGALAGALAGAAVLLPLAGCGEDEAGGEQPGARPALTVSAAASLKPAFERCARAYDGASLRFSFAGSDELAAQIRRGVRPDVYAAANTDLPAALAREGRLEGSVAFAGNRLVIATPPTSSVRSLRDLARAGTDLVIGDPAVPVGAYAREVLSRAPGGERRAIVANVRSEEPDVGGVVGKLTQGAADAGFVYATDVAATAGALRAVDLPAALEPRVAYGMGVVAGAREPEAARAFVRDARAGACARVLRRAGFEPPPRG